MSGWGGGASTTTIEAVRIAVADLVVPADGDAIVEARASRDALDARIAEAETAYVKAGRFEVEGFGSMAAFLRHRCSMADGESRRVAKRAARLAWWPEYLTAWQAGEICGAQVDATVAVIPDAHVERFAATAAENASIVGPLDVGDTRQALRAWAERADAAAGREAAEDGIEPPVPDREREVFLARTLGDVADLRGLFDPDSGTVVEHALVAATKPDFDGERRTPAQRRADALVEVCRFFNDHHLTDGPNRRHSRLTVVADIRVLYRAALRGAGVTTAAELEVFLDRRPALGSLERGLFCDAFDGDGGTAHTLDGNPVSDGLVSCISSGGTLERLLTVEGRIIDHGRSIRTFTDAQRRAALARDKGCRRAGCDRPPHQCSVHHVEPWETGGRTDLANAVVKCDHDHLEDHRTNAIDRLDADGTYTVTTPTGVAYTTRPPGWEPPPELPVRTTAKTAPPLPFDPTLIIREPCSERNDGTPPPQLDEPGLPPPQPDREPRPTLAARPPEGRSTAEGTAEPALTPEDHLRRCLFGLHAGPARGDGRRALPRRDCALVRWGELVISPAPGP